MSEPPVSDGFPGETADLPPVERAELVDFLPISGRVRRPGPGLPEAIGWVMGLLVVRLGAGLFFAAALTAYFVVSGSVTDVAQGLNRLMEPETMVSLAGAEQFFFVLLVLAMAAFRYAGRLGQVINLSPPRPLHVLVVLGLVLPLSTLSTQFYSVALAGWQAVAEFLPVLKILDGLNAVEQIPELVTAAPLPLMLLIVAVAPALGEELLFRGMLGRGLVARWGLVWGVLLTSVLFGIMHMHPVHALAVIPLGIALHLIYVATRSFWAPVLLHFLNNAWATVASKYAGNEVAAVEAAISPALLLSSAIAVIVLGALLYTTRVRYLTADGEEWHPGYVSVEIPDPDSAVRVESSPTTGRHLLTAGSAWGAFGLAFIAEVTALAR